MSRNLVVVQQYLSWNGHYKQYFENLMDSRYCYLYASNKIQNYENAEWIKSEFNAEKPLTIKAKIKGRFLDSFKIYKYLSSANFKVIHLIEFEPLTYLLFADRFKRKPHLLITIHSSDKLYFSNWLSNKLSILQRWLLDSALKKAVNAGSYIVTHYECHKESIVNVVGENFRNKVIVINYPAPKPEKNQVKVYNNKNEPKYLIYGQIREDKGIYEFLKNESTKCLNITIAGKVVDQRIFEFADRDKLTIVDKFLSDQEISNLVDTHDFMLLPYPLEYTNGAGTFKDSLSKAMPVICSNISIFQEIISLHHVGLIFKHPDEIAKMTKLITESDYKLLSQNCLTYAYQYDWVYMRKAYFKLYNDVISLT
jgi:ribosomal protein L30E